MEARAVIKHIRISPRKLRLVANLVRSKKLDDAMTILSLQIVKGAAIVRKALLSAAANARVKDREAKHLVIRTILVDPGVTWKRFMPAAMGRATRIRKRTSHLTVVLENRPPQTQPAAPHADGKKTGEAAASRKAKAGASAAKAPEKGADTTKTPSRKTAKAKTPKAEA